MKNSEEVSQHLSNAQLYNFYELVDAFETGLLSEQDFSNKWKNLESQIGFSLSQEQYLELQVPAWKSGATTNIEVKYNPYKGTEYIKNSIMKDFQSILNYLSPENLHMDGEASSIHVLGSYTVLTQEWKTLESIIGRRVTEEEVYSWEEPSRLSQDLYNQFNNILIEYDSFSDQYHRNPKDLVVKEKYQKLINEWLDLEKLANREVEDDEVKHYLNQKDNKLKM